MEKLVIERSIWISAPQERVWEAVTHPDQLVQWFAPSLPGATMQRDETGKITVHLGPMAADFVVLDMAGAPGQVTVRSLPDQMLAVTYKLAGQAGGTQVTVNISGLELLPLDMREDRLELVGAGWDKTLQNLKAFVDGAALPFPHAYVGPLFG